MVEIPPPSRSLCPLEVPGSGGVPVSAYVSDLSPFWGHAHVPPPIQEQLANAFPAFSLLLLEEEATF